MHRTFAKGLVPLAVIASTAAPALASARTFEIAAGEARRTLPAFARQAKIRLLANASSLEGERTNALRGEYTFNDALKMLIANSRLRIVSIDDRTVVIARSTAPQPAATVTGQATVSGTTAPPVAVSRTENATAEPQVAVADIIVTAVRREERLQNVPISVTALSGSDLVRQGVTQTLQLPQVVPGLILARNTTILQPSIRGVGSRAATAGDESNVAIYVDGIYQPETYTGLFDLLKVDRVEVLRGPQGTLFGRNSTGGLINVITADPKFDYHGTVGVRLGNFGERSLQGYLTGPISDTLAFDIGGLYAEDDGFVRNLNTGGWTGGRRNVALRSKLLYKPSDGFRTVVALSYLDSNDRSGLAVQPIDNQTVGRSRGATNLPTEPWQSALSFDPYAKVRQFSASVQSHIDLSGVALDLAASYQYNRLLSLTDSDASNANVQFTLNTSHSRNLSGEARLSSTGGGPFRWIAGVYLFQNRANYLPIITQTTVPVNVQFAENLTQSIAGFAEGTYAITPSLSVIVGGRYTYETRRFTATNTNTVNTVSIRGDTNFSQFTPRAILKYDISRRANVYASYSRGFKSGVFNTGARSTVPVQPEKITAYEIGLKADPLPWLRANFSAFYYAYSNIQLSQRDATGVSILQNAGVATMKGGEAEITVRASRALTLRAAGSLLDGKFDSFPNAIVTVPLATGGNSQIGIDASGKRLIRAPRHTVNLSANYERATSIGTIGGSVSTFLSGGFYWDYLNRLRQPGYGLLNAEISLATVNRRVRVALYGTNLTNEAVQSGVVTSTLGDYQSYQRPRSYGVSLTTEF